MIIALAARHKLPAIYSQRLFVITGGLISYAGQSKHCSVAKPISGPIKTLD